MDKLSAFSSAFGRYCESPMGRTILRLFGNIFVNWPTLFPAFSDMFTTFLDERTAHRGIC